MKFGAGCIALMHMVVSATSLLAQSTASTPLSTYTSTMYAFTLEYPSNLTPAQSGSVGSELASDIGMNGVGMAGDQVVGFIVTRFDASKYPDFSDFSEATWVSVVVSSDLPACYAPVPSASGPAAVSPTDVTINGVHFKRVDAIASAMGGRTIEVIENRIIHDGRCYSVEDGSLNSPGAGGSGATAAETDAFNAAWNSAAQTTVADAIVNSFQFTDNSTAGTASGSPALPPPGAVHLPFAIGSTRVTAEGVKTGNYVVTAASGQPLLVAAVPDELEDETLIGVTGVPEGTVLLSGQERRSMWHGMLTRTGDFLISVGCTGSRGKFKLTVEAPAPVRFPTGVGRASRSGPTPGGLPVDYVVHASKGQTLSASVTPSDGSAELELTRLSEAPNYPDDSYPPTQPLQFTAYQFVAPSDDDYIISVVPRSGAVIHYTLDIALMN